MTSPTLPAPPSVGAGDLRRDALSSAVAWAIALAVLLAWPNRASADQNLVVIAGFGVAIVVLSLFATGRLSRPKRASWPPSIDTTAILDFMTMTRSPGRSPGRPNPASRPLRFRLPQVLTYLAAFAVHGSLRAFGSPDWGIRAFAINLGLLLVGVLISNLWWEQSGRPERRG